jgi:hypothetical protein
MLERLHKKIVQAHYGALFFELAIVVAGILIAFQIDRWAEERRERQLEQDYLLRLKTDLALEIAEMEYSISNAKSRIAAVRLLNEVVEDPSGTRHSPTEVLIAIEKATWASFPQINAFVYSELQSTGNLALIRSQSLRRELATHYQTIKHYSRVGFANDVQEEFVRLTAGILTMDELTGIELETWDGAANPVRVERALEAVIDLAEREDAIALLPSIAQHNVFNLKVIEGSRERALAIIEKIDRLLQAEQPEPPMS